MRVKNGKLTKERRLELLREIDEANRRSEATQREEIDQVSKIGIRLIEHVLEEMTAASARLRAAEWWLTRIHESFVSPVSGKFVRTSAHKPQAKFDGTSAIKRRSGLPTAREMHF